MCSAYKQINKCKVAENQQRLQQERRQTLSLSSFGKINFHLLFLFDKAALLALHVTASRLSISEVRAVHTCIFVVFSNHVFVRI